MEYSAEWLSDPHKLQAIVSKHFPQDKSVCRDNGRRRFALAIIQNHKRRVAIDLNRPETAKCPFDGSFTLASPLGDNLQDVVVHPKSYLIAAADFVATNTNVALDTTPTFRFSKNAAGQVDGMECSRCR